MVITGSRLLLSFINKNIFVFKKFYLSKKFKSLRTTGEGDRDRLKRSMKDFLLTRFVF